jgi:hypothetical protein
MNNEFLSLIASPVSLPLPGSPALTSSQIGLNAPEDDDDEDDDLEDEDLDDEDDDDEDDDGEFEDEELDDEEE